MVDNKNNALNEAMTKRQRQAAMDACIWIVTDGSPEEMDFGGQGQGGSGDVPAMSKEFTDAWNKIMSMYDDDKITKAELTQILQDILDGKTVEL